MSKSTRTIELATNLLEYFHGELNRALLALDVRTEEETQAYLVHMLDGYARMDERKAMEIGFHRPAAFMLGDALEAHGEERIEAFRRLGDACLYSCGFFDKRLSRRNIDPGYYRQLGRDAYDRLGDLMHYKQPDGPFSTIFRELSVKFDTFVEAFRTLRSGSSTQQAEV